MKVKCIATLRKDLHQRTREVLVTRDFELSVGHFFTAYGISIWHGVLHYLITDAKPSDPFWFLAELFVVEDNWLPKKTYYMYFGLKDRPGVNALWGYREMVFEDQHYVD